MTTPTFSESALWQLMECYGQGKALADGTPAVEGWVTIIQAAIGSPEDLQFVEMKEDLLDERYHDDEHVVLCAVALAGMIELGLLAGYLDFTEMHDASGAAAVRDALKQLDLQQLEGAMRTDLTLFRALRERYDNGIHPVAIPDEATFSMFEAYVGLSRSVLGDEPCRRFVVATKKGSQPLDAAVLLSPRHFADAYAMHRIGAIATPEVAGGIALLRHLDRFESILAQIEQHTLLKDGMVRHARWAGDAYELQSRFDQWSYTMREWDDHAGDGDATAWNDYRSRVFAPLIETQQRLGLSEEKALDFMIATPESALVEAARLRIEGRIGAARIRLRDEARERFRALRQLSGPEWGTEVEQLISVCVALADAGDADSAAVYIAPLISDIATREGTSYQMYVDAARVVSQARLGTEVFGDTDADQATIERDRDSNDAGRARPEPDLEYSSSGAS